MLDLCGLGINGAEVSGRASAENQKNPHALIEPPRTVQGAQSPLQNGEAHRGLRPRSALSRWSTGALHQEPLHGSRERRLLAAELPRCDPSQDTDLLLPTARGPCLGCAFLWSCADRNHLFQHWLCLG